MRLMPIAITVGELRDLLHNVPDDATLQFCATSADHYALGVIKADAWGYSSDQPECGQIKNVFLHAGSTQHSLEIDLVALDDVPYLVKGLVDCLKGNPQ